jgi:DNA polymerase-3 subunit alpha
METGQARQRDAEQGQASLFGAIEEAAGASARVDPPLPETPDWGEAERLAFEKESLGFFISGHPLERFRDEIAQWATATTGRLAELGDSAEVAVGGLVTGLRLLKTRKGDRMASFTLEDLEGGVEALVFPKTYKELAGRLVEDQVVLVKGRSEGQEEGKPRLLVSELLPLDQAKLADARFVTIRCPVERWSRETGQKLLEALEAHRGDCPVTLELFRPGSWRASVAPSAYYRVRPDAALKSRLEELLGPDALGLSRSGPGRGPSLAAGGS